MSNWIKRENKLPEIRENVLTKSVTGYESVSFLLEDGSWDNTLNVEEWRRLDLIKHIESIIAVDLREALREKSFVIDEIFMKISIEYRNPETGLNFTIKES